MKKIIAILLVGIFLISLTSAIIIPRDTWDFKNIFNIQNVSNLTISSNLTIKNLINCDTIDTDSNGLLKCGTDGGGGGNPFDQELNTTQNVTFDYLILTHNITGQTKFPISNGDLVNKLYVDEAVEGADFDFFLSDGPADITGYFNMTESDLDLPETTLTSPSLPVISSIAIFNFTTLEGQPEFRTLSEGIYNLHIHALKTAGTQEVKLSWEMYNRTGTVETLILTSSSQTITSSQVAYDIRASNSNEVFINSGDKLIVKVFAEVISGGSAPTVQIVMEGTTDSHFSIRTNTGAFENIFLRQDGTKPLNANWNVGGFNITADTFKGIFNWIIDTVGGSTSYFTFNGTTLTFDETKLNATIDDKVIANNTVRWQNITSYACSGTDKVTGVHLNGTLICGADGGGGNIFNQELNTTENVQFANITSIGNLTVGSNATFQSDSYFLNDTKLYFGTEGQSFIFYDSINNISVWKVT